MPMLLLLIILSAPLPLPGGGAGARAEMVHVAGGSYLPLYGSSSARVRVAPFELDRYPVSRSDYLRFVKERPEWRRSRIRAVFAAPGYLRDWAGDLDPGGREAAEHRVTDVSWFAARAYCAWQGKRLPTTHEWEFAALASETERDATREPAFRQRLLELATRRNPAAQPIGSGFRNVYGIEDLHGVGWEWVADFNSTLSSDDSRSGGAQERQLFCAAAAMGTTDPSNYAGFLRFAMRGTLQGSTVTGNLGFRCAR